MQKQFKLVWLVVALVVGLVIGANLSDKSGSILGGLVHPTQEQFPQGLKAGLTNQLSVNSSGAITIGASGSSLSQVIKGSFTNSSCSGASTQTALAVTKYQCTITGILSGDIVIVTMSTSTVANVFVSGAAASTTAGYAVVVLGNASSTSAAATTTGATYVILR